MANLLYRARAEQAIERGRGWSAELPRFIDYRSKTSSNRNSSVPIAKGIEICFIRIYYN